MGTAFLKMDQSRVKWRFKLARAFDRSLNASGNEDVVKSTGEKWALFLLPFITVVRVSVRDQLNTRWYKLTRLQEGLEAVVFVGGVSWPS